MRKILHKITNLFHVEYRLTEIVRGKYINTYGTDKKLLIGRAKSPGIRYWSLYKKGPFNLPEREVRSGANEWNENQVFYPEKK